MSPLFLCLEKLSRKLSRKCPVKVSNIHDNCQIWLTWEILKNACNKGKIPFSWDSLNGAIDGT